MVGLNEFEVEEDDAVVVGLSVEVMSTGVSVFGA